MHTHDLSPWTHVHQFSSDTRTAERGTRWVMWITLVTMVVEIAAGWWFNSMALLADGWHMSSHAMALGLASFAYAASRRLAADPRFSFGTWKIEILAAFTSAVLLIGVALLMVVGSIERWLSPQPIAYNEAIAVAIAGLVVNLVCAWILARSGQGHEHGHGHSHGHSHGHAHGQHAHEHAHGDHAQAQDAASGARDLNLQAAYVHVLTDAATSILAILALCGGLFFGWAWLDAAMGIVGAVLVGSWARRLMIETGTILLDREMDHPVVAEIREVVEAGEGEPRVTDLHVWRVGREAFACAVTLVTHDASETAATVRARIAEHEEVVHSTIEIHRCHA